MKNKSNHHDLTSISKTWHSWWEILSRAFPHWVTISFVPWFFTYFLLLIVRGRFILALTEAHTWLELFSLKSTTIYFLIIGGLLIFLLQTFGALVLVVGAVLNDQLHFKTAFKTALKFFWRYILLGIISISIYTVVIIASYMLVTLLAIPISALNALWLKNFFGWLELIPFFCILITNVYLVFAPYLLVDKNYSVFSVFKKSFQLVRGHFWPITLRLLMAYISIGFISLLLSLIPYVGFVLSISLAAASITIFIYVLYKDLITFKP